MTLVNSSSNNQQYSERVVSSNEIEHHPYQHYWVTCPWISVSWIFYPSFHHFSRALCFNTATSSLTPADPSAPPWALRKWGFVHICPNMTKKQQRAENCSLPLPNSTHTSDPNHPQYFLSLLLTGHIPGRDKLVGFYLRGSLKHTQRNKYILLLFLKVTYTFTERKAQKWNGLHGSKLCAPRFSAH